MTRYIAYTMDAHLSRLAVRRCRVGSGVRVRDLWWSHCHRAVKSPTSTLLILIKSHVFRRLKPWCARVCRRSRLCVGRHKGKLISLTNVVQTYFSNLMAEFEGDLANIHSLEEKMAPPMQLHHAALPLE